MAAQEARRGEYDSGTITKAEEDNDSISVLADLSAYSPLERINVLDAVFAHGEEDTENNTSEALVSMRKALKIVVGSSKTWHLPSQR